MTPLNLIPFTEKLAPREGHPDRIYLGDSNICYKTYGPLIDRGIFLAWGTIGIVIQLGESIIKIGNLFGDFIRNLANGELSAKDLPGFFICIAVYVVASAIGTVYFQVAALFGVFFANNAKKICCEIEEGLEKTSIFYNVFKPKEADSTAPPQDQAPISN